jgi:hypothetical protein
LNQGLSTARVGRDAIGIPGESAEMAPFEILAFETTTFVESEPVLTELGTKGKVNAGNTMVNKSAPQQTA